MRAFIALRPVPEVVADLARFIEPRAEACPDWRWTPDENYHVTLAFLGDIDAQRGDRLEEELEPVAAAARPFEARLSDAGAFASVLKARHLYAGVRSDDVDRLAARVRGAALRAGCPLDRADRYVAHVTLARRPRLVDATHLWRVLDSYVGDPWKVTEFALFRSELGQGRDGHPRYVAERRFPLGG